MAGNTDSKLTELGIDVDPGSPNPEAVTPRSGTMEDHRSLLDEMHDMSDEDLRDRAVAQGIDGAQTMTRDHLLAKLMDEPGANEL